jgi:hypothetical protein
MIYCAIQVKWIGIGTVAYLAWNFGEWDRSTVSLLGLSAAAYFGGG